MPDLNKLALLIQSSQKTLFILCGFPYAGKSYVANILREEVTIELVSIDSIFYSHKFDWDTNTLPNKEEWQQIFNESYKKVKETLMQDKNVLYDSTNQTLKSRNKLREIATSVRANTKVIYIQSPAETVWKRWEENQKNMNRSVVSKKLVQATIDMFEEPTVNEDVIVIKN